MYKGYKIIITTAAGRRRYMQYLVPHILSCDIVDKYEIWVHTHNVLDIEFLKQIAAKYEKVELVWQPDGIVGGNETINPFYRHCIKPDTIYFKIDDDMVWMEENAIIKMVDYRINNKQFFIVSPLIINNPICSYLLEISNILPINKSHLIGQIGDTYWLDGHFAYDLHKWFLNEKINRIESLYIGAKSVSINRFSINAILWFGEDFAKIGNGGEVSGDDEEFISCKYPATLGISNGINGDCVMSHYAFYPQREHLDKSDILDKYSSYYKEHNSPLNAQYFDEIFEIYSMVDNNSANISKQSSPYKYPEKKRFSEKYSIKRFLKKVTKKNHSLFPTTDGE